MEGKGEEEKVCFCVSLPLASYELTNNLDVGLIELVWSPFHVVEDDVTVGCSMLEPLPQGKPDRRVSSAENEARQDWPMKQTEDNVPSFLKF